MNKIEPTKLFKWAFTVMLVAYFPLIILLNVITSFSLIVFWVTVATTTLWTVALVKFLYTSKDIFKGQDEWDREIEHTKNVGKELYYISEAVKNLSISKLGIDQDSIDQEVREIKKRNG